MNPTLRKITSSLFLLCLLSTGINAQISFAEKDIAVVLKNEPAAFGRPFPAARLAHTFNEGEVIRITGISDEPYPDWEAEKGGPLTPEGGFYWYETEAQHGRKCWIYGRDIGVNVHSQFSRAYEGEGLDVALEDLDGDGTDDAFVPVLRINREKEYFIQYLVRLANGNVFLPESYSLSLEHWAPYVPGKTTWQDLTGNGQKELIVSVYHGMEGGSESNYEVYGMYEGKLKRLFFAEEYIAYSYSDRYGMAQCSDFMAEEEEISQVKIEFVPDPDLIDGTPYHLLQKSHVVHQWDSDSLAFVKKQSTSPNLPVIAEVKAETGHVFADHSSRTPVIGTLKPGDHAEVLGVWTKLQDGELNAITLKHWVYVRLADEKKGWINSGILHFDEPSLQEWFGHEAK